MRTALALLLVLPVSAFAAGGGSAPATTPTTSTCANGQVWDDKTKACVNPDNASLSEQDRIDAVRELAYAGRTDDALRVLDSVADQSSDLVLTYRGFTARQLGDMDAAMTAYKAALTLNPDNILARSYMGQGLVTLGDLAGAQAQLIEIRARGGVGTWAEASLDTAIRTGKTYNY